MKFKTHLVLWFEAIVRQESSVHLVIDVYSPVGFQLGVVLDDEEEDGIHHPFEYLGRSSAVDERPAEFVNNTRGLIEAR